MSSSDASSESKPQEGTSSGTKRQHAAVECFTDLPSPQRKKICGLERKQLKKINRFILLLRFATDSLHAQSCGRSVLEGRVATDSTRALQGRASDVPKNVRKNNILVSVWKHYVSVH